MERVFWHANAFMTSTKSTERTHEASDENVLNEDELQFLI